MSNIADMSGNQLQNEIENSAEVIRAAQAGSTEFSPEQVEQASDRQQQIAAYLEQVGDRQVELKGLDISSLQALLAS